MGLLGGDSIISLPEPHGHLVCLTRQGRTGEQQALDVTEQLDGPSGAPNIGSPSTWDLEHSETEETQFRKVPVLSGRRAERLVLVSISTRGRGAVYRS